MQWFNVETIIRYGKARTKLGTSRAATSMHDALIREITALQKYGHLTDATDFAIDLKLDQRRTDYFNENDCWSEQS